METVLVTGGFGLVGNAIQRIEKNEKMRFVYISSSEFDLCDMDATKKMFDKYNPDYVIHLAACVGGLFKNMTRKIDMFEKNIQINYNVVKCCHDFHIKKLVACLSTCIFPDKTTYPIDETMLHDGPPHESNDAYAYAKRMLEMHCRIYRENFGDNFVCVIPTNIYGPNDNFNLEDAHVIPALIHKCYLAKEADIDFVVRGSGTPLRQFIYSDDLAHLLLYTLFSNSFADNVILSVDESEEVSIKDVALLISKRFAYDNRIVFDKAFDDGQYKKTASNERLRQICPDFQFLSIDEGIQYTVDWFIENYKIARK